MKLIELIGVTRNFWRRHTKVEALKKTDFSVARWRVLVAIIGGTKRLKEKVHLLL